MYINIHVNINIHVYINIHYINIHGILMPQPKSLNQLVCIGLANEVPLFRSHDHMGD